MSANRSLLLCALLATSCAPSHPYTVADRQTFDALAPDYTNYVLNDATLSQPQRELKQLTVETWRMRLEAAEEVQQR